MLGTPLLTVQSNSSCILLITSAEYLPHSSQTSASCDHLYDKPTMQALAQEKVNKTGSILNFGPYIHLRKLTIQQ